MISQRVVSAPRGKEPDIGSGRPTPNPTAVVAAYVASLQQGLSVDRLAPYRLPGGSDLDMVTTYFWNVALCQALYHSLDALEVSMRNGIHNALTGHFGTAAWYDIPNLLLQRETDDVADVKRKIARSRKPVIPPRVVAGLNYGFWTSLLDTGYGNSVWTASNPAVLVQRAFPRAPLHFQVRGRAHGRFNEIRSLRNRVFHYEPVWKGVPMQNGQVVRLGDLHHAVIDTIGWVDQTLQATVIAFDRFPNLFQHGRITVEWEIKQLLGIP